MSHSRQQQCEAGAEVAREDSWAELRVRKVLLDAGKAEERDFLFVQ